MPSVVEMFDPQPDPMGHALALRRQGVSLTEAASRTGVARRAISAMEFRLRGGANAPRKNWVPTRTAKRTGVVHLRAGVTAERQPIGDEDKERQFGAYATHDENGWWVGVPDANAYRHTKRRHTNYFVEILCRSEHEARVVACEAWGFY
jgi:hypothetical protein